MTSTIALYVNNYKEVVIDGKLVTSRFHADCLNFAKKQ